MKKMIALSVCGAAFSLGTLNAAEPMATAEVSVDLGTALGPVKPMHAVNNGPSVNKPGGDQKCGNFETYAAARVPFARTHDSINCVSGGAHTCDINALFPNFDADENDPKNSSSPTITSTISAALGPRCSSASGRRSSMARRNTESCHRRISRSGRASANM